MKKQKFKQTHREYVQQQDFITKCEKHGVKQTVRQASKYRNRRGILYQKEHGLI